MNTTLSVAKRRCPTQNDVVRQKRRRPTKYYVVQQKTTSSDGYDVVRHHFCQKSHLIFCMFVLETLAFQSIKKLGIFFSTPKFIMNSNDFHCNLFAFLEVHFLNFNLFFIALGRRMPSLPAQKLQSQAIFFQVLFFVS